MVRTVGLEIITFDAIVARGKFKALKFSFRASGIKSPPPKMPLAAAEKLGPRALPEVISAAVLEIVPGK